MRGLIIAVSAVAILAIIAFLFVNNSNKNQNTTSDQSVTKTNDTSTQSEVPQSSSDNTEQAQSNVTITFNNGFSPSRVTVASGGTVTVKNDSNREIQFDSDPHPSHTGNTELNLGTVEAGESKTFNVNRTGSFGYHNHLDSSETGTIVVQ